MPIFISYSHADKAFVDELALDLVKHEAHVWVDTWELNVGDSILDRVQNAIQDSSALLIVLSRASVASEWCKKELNAGLMRELAEKRVVVLPVLVEDCEIPVFLREKVYADFRADYQKELKALVEAVARVTKIDQGRFRTGGFQIDWSETWGYLEGHLLIEFAFVEFSQDCPFTLLTEISIHCDDGATKRYEQFSGRGLDWFGRGLITETLCEFAQENRIEMTLTDQHPQIRRVLIRDPKRGRSYKIQIRCRRMGEDNGRDQMVHVTNYIEQVRDQIRRELESLPSRNSNRYCRF